MCSIVTAVFQWSSGCLATHELLVLIVDLAGCKLLLVNAVGCESELSLVLINVHPVPGK